MSNKSARSNLSFKENEITNLTPKTKKELMMIQKQDSARKVREERQRLRDEKERKQQDFLEKTANRREEQELNLEIQRLTAKHAYSLSAAEKELEATNLQWKLEQERMHRAETKALEKQERMREGELKAKERENKMARKKQLEEENMRSAQAHEDKLMRQLREEKIFEESKRLEKEHNIMLEDMARNERLETERRMRSDAERREAESRELEDAAYRDVQQYLKNEKAKRRQSIQMRIEEERSFKKRQQLQQLDEETEENESRDLEQLAYNDMKSYLAQEKKNRRQSLADFLQQESDFRNSRRRQMDDEAARLAESRKLDDLARQDALNYILREKKARRESMATRLYTASVQDMEGMIEACDKRDAENASRKLDMDARGDVVRVIEGNKAEARIMDTRTKLEELHAIELKEKGKLVELERMRIAKEQTFNSYLESLAELEPQKIEEDDEEEHDTEEEDWLENEVSESDSDIVEDIEVPVIVEEQIIKDEPEIYVEQEEIVPEQATKVTKPGCWSMFTFLPKSFFRKKRTST